MVRKCCQKMLISQEDFRRTYRRLEIFCHHIMGENVPFVKSGGHEDGIRGSHASAPFFSGFWAPYPDFVIPLSFYLKLVCKPHFT